jgi:hypothetical protein
VFYVLDFSCNGYSGGGFCQKCYDPDCKGYRSPWGPLPTEVWQQQRLLEAAKAYHQQQQQQGDGPQQQRATELLQQQ